MLGSSSSSFRPLGSCLTSTSRHLKQTMCQELFHAAAVRQKVKAAQSEIASLHSKFLASCIHVGRYWHHGQLLPIYKAGVFW